MKWEGCILDASDFDRVEYLPITRHLMHMRDFMFMQGNYSGPSIARDTILVEDDQDERTIWKNERNVYSRNISDGLKLRLAKTLRLWSPPADIPCLRDPRMLFIHPHKYLQKQCVVCVAADERNDICPVENNPYIKGDHMYQANYRDGGRHRLIVVCYWASLRTLEMIDKFEGVRFSDDHPTGDIIVDVPDEVDPKKVSVTEYSQTRLTDDENARFTGAWTTYQNSKFGNYIASSIGRSLFDLKRNGLSDGVPSDGASGVKEKCRLRTGGVGPQIDFGPMDVELMKHDPQALTGCWVSRRSDGESPLGSYGRRWRTNLCERFTYDNPPWRWVDVSGGCGVCILCYDLVVTRRDLKLGLLMNSGRYPGEQGFLPLLRNDQGFLPSLRRTVEAKLFERFRLTKEVMSHDGRRRLIVVCRRKVFTYYVVSRSDWLGLGHKGDTARPPGQIIAQCLRDLIPVPGMVRNYRRLYQREVKPKFWHGLAMSSTTCQSNDTKNSLKKQTTEEFCTKRALRSGSVHHCGRGNFEIWVDCWKALWMCLGAPRRFVLRFPDFISPRKIISFYLKIHGTMWNWYENTSGGRFGPRSGDRLVETYLSRSQRHRFNCGVNETPAGRRIHHARQTATSGVSRIALVVAWSPFEERDITSMHSFLLTI